VSNLRFGVLPRGATDSSQLVWFDTGLEGFCWHCVGAREEGDRLTLWLPLYRVPYPKDLPGHLPGEPDSFLHKVVLNLKTRAVECLEQRADVGVTERCAINNLFVGAREPRYGYLMLRGDAEMYNGFAKFDMLTEKVVAKVDYGPTRFGGEAFFVPRPGGTDEDDGWLMDIVYDKATEKSELCIWDAAKLSESTAPIAVVHPPHRIPYGVHALWLEPEELARQWRDGPQPQAPPPSSRL
jgi:carotenoid cleavage dioxygenase